VHAGADERVQSTRWQIEGGRTRGAGDVDIDFHSPQPVACFAGVFSVLDEAHDPALLHAKIVHANLVYLRKFLSQQRT